MDCFEDSMGLRRTRSWRVVELALLGLASLCAAIPIAAAAEPTSCLSPDERRAIIASHQAVPLSRAMNVVKARIPGDIVKARLCRQEIGLVYVLTVLARNGKVMQARVDAANGHWLGAS
jgi:uncharacterized membrane protein YkoI